MSLILLYLMRPFRARSIREELTIVDTSAIIDGGLWIYLN